MTSAVSVGMSRKMGLLHHMTVSNAPVAPHGLLDVVSCSCSAERKACSEKRCNCHSAGFPVRSTVGDACCSPFNKHTEDDQLADDMQEDEGEADDDE